MPKVSVIISTYNRNKELTERCLPSIFNQTFKNYEVIVINDGSTEPYVLSRAYPFLFHYHENETNKGKSYSVNLGVKLAKGKYVVIVDDDNELMPTFLEETVKAMEDSVVPLEKLNDGNYHPMISAVQTGRIIKHTGFDDYAPALPLMGFGFHSIDWGWLIKKEVFDVIQYDENMFMDEDADFGIQFFKRFSALALNKPLQICYAQGSSYSFPSKSRLEALDRFLVKNTKEYAKAGPKDLGFLYRFAARTFYLGGNKKRANQLFWQAFKAYPNRRTLTHYLVSLINYKAYYQLMRLEEKYYARKRNKQYGI